MRSQRFTGATLALVTLISIGCNQPEDPATMNTPPYDAAESRRELAEFFAYHQDNGLLAQRAIADMHFVPGTSHLSGAGEAQLARLAEIMQDTGGTINYDTSLGDSGLAGARLASARQFLSTYTVGKKPIQVAFGMAGGRGMDAVEAVDGRGVAQQAEPRGSAYRLGPGAGAGGGGAGGGN